MKKIKGNENFSYFGVKDEDQKFYVDKIEPSKQAKLDGYHFGDRILEGVMFIFTIENDNTLSVKVNKDSKSYFKTLNKKMWYKRAIEYAITTDIFDSMNDEDDISLITKYGKYCYE